ncbi:MAG: metallophosphoesterase [Bacteroidota bacterium]|nr:metallophosphoesterase [Bacteroidota bacterium]
MKQLIFLVTLVSSGLLSFSQNNNYLKEEATGYHGPVIKNLKAVKGLSFCVIGDWGRYGDYYQAAVAEKLGSAVIGVDASFIISTGDNIYPNGVISEYDPAWKYAYEDVYKTYPTHINWYVVLGNHDYKTNPDAEVAYSKISARWHMPARYFSIKKNIKGDSSKTVEFFFIDTTPFQKDYYSEPDYAAHVAGNDTAAQRNWLINGLKNSTATWKIVVGHHPLYSAGKRKGKLGDMIDAFREIFEKYKVDAYFCGHEHQLEVDQEKGYHFYQFISGAGSESTAVTSAPYTKFTAQDHGFLTAAITGTEMLVQYINADGKILFTTMVKK